MNSPKKHKFQPDYAIHAGETLAETIERLGMCKLRKDGLVLEAPTLKAKVAGGDSAAP